MQTTEDPTAYARVVDEWNGLARVRGLQEAELLKASEELAAVSNVARPDYLPAEAATQRRQRRLANVVIVAARSLAAHKHRLDETQRRLKRLAVLVRAGSNEIKDVAEESLNYLADAPEATQAFAARNPVENAATLGAHACVAAAAALPGMWVNTDQIRTLALCPVHRLTLIVVRCGSGRFIAPAQDVALFMRLIENDPHKQTYVRDAAIHPDSDLAIEVKAVKP